MLRYVIHNWERKLSRRDNNRVERPFDWGTEYLEPGLCADAANGGGSHPRDIFAKFNRCAIANSNSFFSAQTSTDYEFDGHWVRFASPVTTPYVENNTVFARYFPVADNSNGKNGTSSSDVERARGRAVVVLPHWNAKPHEHVALCELLNRAGIAALRLSLPYHDGRMLPGFERADFMVSANLGRTLQANRQAVLDTRAAIDWFEKRGYHRIGIVGTSLGSCIGFLTFVHEPRIKVGVYYHVSSYFGDVVWQGLTTAHVRRALETELSNQDVRNAWLAISPNSYVDRLAGDSRRGLLISARYDLSFTPELSQMLFRECDRHGTRLDRVIVPCGHYSLGRSPYKYYAGYLLVKYLRKHL
jgi:hypothetical protein